MASSHSKALQLTSFLNGASILMHHKKDHDVGKYLTDILRQHYKLNPACLAESISEIHSNLSVVAYETASRDDDIIAIVNMSTGKLLKDKMKLKGNVTNMDTLWVVTFSEWKIIGLHTLEANNPIKNPNVMHEDELRDLGRKMMDGQFPKELATKLKDQDSDSSKFEDFTSTSNSDFTSTSNSDFTSTSNSDFTSTSNSDFTSTSRVTATQDASEFTVADMRVLFEYSKCLEENIGEVKSFLVSISSSLQSRQSLMKMSPIGDTVNAIVEKTAEIDLLLNALIPNHVSAVQQNSFIHSAERANKMMPIQQKYQAYLTESAQNNLQSIKLSKEEVNLSIEADRAVVTAETHLEPDSPSNHSGVFSPSVKNITIEASRISQKEKRSSHSSTENTEESIEETTHSVDGTSKPHLHHAGVFFCSVKNILGFKKKEDPSETGLNSDSSRHSSVRSTRSDTLDNNGHLEAKIKLENINNMLRRKSVHIQTMSSNLSTKNVMGIESDIPPEGKYAQWKVFVDENSRILLSSLLSKLSGSFLVGYQERQLILTDKPSLLYVNVKTMESKKNMSIFWDRTSPPVAIKTSETSFEIRVHVPQPRAYSFKLSDSDKCVSVDNWVHRINELSSMKDSQQSDDEERSDSLGSLSGPTVEESVSPSKLISRENLSSDSIVKSAENENQAAAALNSSSSRPANNNYVGKLFGSDEKSGDIESFSSDKVDRCDEFNKSPESTSDISINKPKKSLAGNLFGHEEESIIDNLVETTSSSNSYNNSNNSNNNNNNDNNNSNSKYEKSTFSISDLKLSRRSPPRIRSGSPSDAKAGQRFKNVSKDIYSFSERYYLPFLMTYLGINSRIVKEKPLSKKELKEMTQQPIFLHHYYSASDLQHTASSAPKICISPSDNDEYVITGDGTRYVKTVTIKNAEEFVNFHIKSMSLLLWSLIQSYSVTDKLFSDQIKLINVAKILKESGISNITYCELQLAFQKLNMKTAKLSDNKAEKISASGTANLLSTSFQLFEQILTVIYSKNKTIPSAERLREDEFALRQLLHAKNSQYSDLLNSSKICWSGLLIGTHYPYYICKNNTYAKENSGQSIDRSNTQEEIDFEYYNNQYIFDQESIFSTLVDRKKITFSKAEILSVKALWEKNVDQIRSIYNYYAKTICTRKVLNKSGVVGSDSNVSNMSFLMSIDNLKSFLTDFRILPVLIDLPNVVRVFQLVKLWEWELADAFLNQVYNTVSTAGPMKSGSGKHPHRKALSSEQAELIVAAAMPDYDDYLGFTRSHGNLCITLSGFLEFLTRLASINGELGNTPKTCISTLLHFMDENDGKHVMVKRDRGSRAVNRKFIYK